MHGRSEMVNAVWLASFPRSGNTFFRTVLYNRFGVKSYSVSDDPEFFQHNVADVIGHVRMPGPIKDFDSWNHQERLRVIKTHWYPSTLPVSLRSIYLVRDPRDVVVSIAWRYNSKGRGEFLPAMRSRLSTTRWPKHVMAWREHADVIIRFEDLLDTPVRVVRNAVDDVGIDLPKGKRGRRVPSFDDLHRLYPQFFRTGCVGDWKNYMSEEDEQELWDHCGEVAESVGYVRG